MTAVKPEAPSEVKNLAVNRRARHDYEILEEFEAGIALAGSEVKSVRLGLITFKDSYVELRDGQAWLQELHIASYKYTGSQLLPSPTRRRRLLLHKREIAKLSARVAERGLTVVPLAIFLKDHQLVKVKIGLARGKKLYDKRQDLVKREQDREVRRVLKDRGRPRERD